MTATSAAPVAAAAVRPSWSRAVRVGLGLTPLLAVHLALLALFTVPVTLTSLILLVVVTRVSGLGVTVGYHRMLSHHAFKTSRWFRFVLATAGCTALQKGPLWWVIHHRQHHTHSDRPGDVHSPVLDGFWFAHTGWLFARDLTRPDHTSVRDLTRYPELVWLDRLWVVPGLLTAAACYLVGGWAGVVWGYCLGTVLVFQVAFAVNSVGHRWGSQRFATGEGSRNNPVLGVLAMGDGWHNNHHKAPSSARHGLAWYEFDQAYQVIRLMRAVGLVWGVRQPPAAVMAAARRPAAG